ncbi:conserved hypothetical protein [Flavobacterium sp. 9AF]|uniref:hypothetical protein n=1 Tax=Flavobacterium sp. 9AF TaxID=2653142 RepID=UPI0012EF38F8|nr:hypothetical protein [Flavobacterium sp. 9AF]VXB17955.1 conserved hypothetical protein [Flavobacterium sp. 9AF]
MKTYLKLVFFLFINYNLFSQNTYYLEGTVGKSNIYMQITEYDNNYIEGNYFYQKSLKDIHLNGKYKDVYFTLYFGNDYGEEAFEEKFELEKINNKFTGKWVNKTGKTIPVSLKSINFTQYKKPIFKEFDDNLDLIKLNYLNFEQDSIQNYNNQQIIWYSESHCEAPFFRIGESFSTAKKNTINPILIDKHYEIALNQLSCSSPFSYNTGNGIEYSVSITFLNDNLLGYEIFSSYYCGGAHPDFGSEGNLINLHSGKKYELDEIIAFDTSVTKYSDDNFTLFSTYRNTYFAPILYELINLKQKFTQPEESEDYCDYTQLDIWNYPQWSFTEKGIEFTPVFPRVARNCEDTFLVEFESLKKYKHPNFPYNF